MAKRYFENFPLINYTGHPAVNIMRRVKLNENVKNYYTAFYPYTTGDKERIEDIAYNYYEDVNLDWLIYQANDIMDPFYDVPLSYEDLEAFIVKKYTSLRVARLLCLYYKNNWESDDQIISTSTYNALTSGQKKYWEPVYNYGDSVNGYQRTNNDDIISTNKVQEMTFAEEMANTFVIGEPFTSDDGTGQIVWANTTVCSIQHVTGDLSGNSYFQMTGTISNLTANVDASTVTTIVDVIPAAEQIYYSQVIAYDWELEENEKRRDLQIIDKKYSSELVKQMKDILE